MGRLQFDCTEDVFLDRVFNRRAVSGPPSIFTTLRDVLIDHVHGTVSIIVEDPEVADIPEGNKPYPIRLDPI